MTTETETEPVVRYARTQTVPVDAITVADNVRHNLGDLGDLAKSIEAVGLLNPLIVQPGANGDVELIAGHRRLAAVRKLGWTEVAVTFGKLGASRLATQLVENLQREDLDPLEESEGLVALAELLGSQKAAAEAIGRSVAHVSKRLKLARLVPEAKAVLDALPLDAAVELAGLDEKAQRKIAARVADGFTPQAIRGQIDDAQRSAARAVESRKLAGEAAKRRENRKVEVVPATQVKGTWKSLEGYNGLAVDYDAHAREACHRLAVGYFHPWEVEPTEVAYCTEPARHEPEGESKVKIVDTRSGEDAERARLREERAAELAEERARWAAVAVEKAGALDRNTALKVLSLYLIGQLEADYRDLYLSAVGVEVPEAPTVHRYDGNPASAAAWETYDAAVEAVLDGLSIAQAYRAASLYALSVSAASSTPWERQKPSAHRIADLVGIDREIPDEEE